MNEEKDKKYNINKKIKILELIKIRKLMKQIIEDFL